jgi:hypothetical protein
LASEEDEHGSSLKHRNGLSTLNLTIPVKPFEIGQIVLFGKKACLSIIPTLNNVERDVGTMIRDLLGIT